ncbi:hypothetical protein [Chitinophaga rhizophila]|uniref:Uncharacterized protein n=1 Tax=Chitinophaga rhizophila TaxID=2866212 RepID=A0ABS7GAA6_9BACT|nr:hypothetical protein [Chitinophaga rhizophila]MBW8684225.1 hypothetical protein [Chitinophaga rhizophila]
MAKYLQYLKDSPVHLFRVLYVVAFFTLISLLTVPYVKAVAATLGKGTYKDNFDDNPGLTIAFLLLISLIFFVVNKRMFKATKRESNAVWTIHLGIDVVLFALSVLLEISMNALWDKYDFSTRSLLDPVMMLLLLSAKYTFMQVWYAHQDSKYLPR